MLNDELKTDLNRLMEQHRENKGSKTIKKTYHSLIKKYHPDLQSDNHSFYQECTMTINYVYGRIQRGDFQQRNEDPPSCEKGSFVFVSRNGRKERVSDESFYYFRRGVDRILEAREYLCDHPLIDGYGLEIVEEVSRDLYKAVEYLKRSIHLGKGKNWVQEAHEKIQWAYEINERITRNLMRNAGKDIVIAP